MDLPSFTWLWRIAAWSMGISITLYFSLAIVGIFYRMQRLRRKLYYWRWLRYLHYGLGVLFVFFVYCGDFGSLWQFGSLLALARRFGGSDSHFSICMDSKSYSPPTSLGQNLAFGIEYCFVCWLGFSIFKWLERGAKVFTLIPLLRLGVLARN